MKYSQFSLNFSAYAQEVNEHQQYLLKEVAEVYQQNLNAPLASILETASQIHDPYFLLNILDQDLPDSQDLIFLSKLVQNYRFLIFSKVNEQNLQNSLHQIISCYYYINCMIYQYQSQMFLASISSRTIFSFSEDEQLFHLSCIQNCYQFAFSCYQQCKLSFKDFNLSDQLMEFLVVEWFLQNASLLLSPPLFQEMTQNFEQFIISLLSNPFQPQNQQGITPIDNNQWIQNYIITIFKNQFQPLFEQNNEIDRQIIFSQCLIFQLKFVQFNQSQLLPPSSITQFNDNPLSQQLINQLNNHDDVQLPIVTYPNNKQQYVNFINEHNIPSNYDLRDYEIQLTQLQERVRKKHNNQLSFTYQLPNDINIPPFQNLGLFRIRQLPMIFYNSIFSILDYRSALNQMTYVQIESDASHIPAQVPQLPFNNGAIVLKVFDSEQETINNQNVRYTFNNQLNMPLHFNIFQGEAFSMSLSFPILMRYQNHQHIKFKQVTDSKSNVSALLGNNTNFKNNGVFQIQQYYRYIISNLENYQLRFMKREHLVDADALTHPTREQVETWVQIDPGTFIFSNTLPQVQRYPTEILDAITKQNVQITFQHYLEKSKRQLTRQLPISSNSENYNRLKLITPLLLKQDNIICY